MDMDKMKDMDRMNRISGGPDSPEEHMKELHGRIDDYAQEREQLQIRINQIDQLINSHQQALTHYEGPSLAQNVPGMRG